MYLWYLYESWSVISAVTAAYHEMRWTAVKIFQVSVKHTVSCWSCLFLFVHYYLCYSLFTLTDWLTDRVNSDHSVSAALWKQAVGLFQLAHTQQHSRSLVFMLHNSCWSFHHKPLVWKCQNKLLHYKCPAAWSCHRLALSWLVPPVSDQPPVYVSVSPSLCLCQVISFISVMLRVCLTPLWVSGLCFSQFCCLYYGIFCMLDISCCY